MTEKIIIQTEFIKLDQMLKYSGAASTGGEAKAMVAAGEVLLNGDVCLQRGKKLKDGDLVSVRGKSFVIAR